MSSHTCLSQGRDPACREPVDRMPLPRSHELALSVVDGHSRRANRYARPGEGDCVYAARNCDTTAPNLLNRDFTAPAPDRVWVGDVTFIATREGWLYLAVLLDLYSRKVVGWAMGRRQDRQLVIDALTMAIEHRRPTPGLVHHTDQGILYATSVYRAILTQQQMIPS